ncbi:MAG TPA: hypothetical protein VL971_09415 [Rhizomicrobium sp.]|jgi:hypothetical protein|nr:hypothetical protein [Rhizomicrobium sp.]
MLSALWNKLRNAATGEHRDVLELSPGVVGSLLLHGFAALLILFFLVRGEQQIAQKQTPFVPVDVVPLGPQTTAPPAPKHSVIPEQRAARGPLGSPKPQGVSPHGTKPLPDELTLKLKNLARLRAPDSDLKIDNDGTADQTASDGGASGPAAYSVKDYIRAQVLRRWSLDLGKLGKRSFIIPLHIEISGRGFVTDVEFVELQRFKTDALYRDIAISARNAVLLSSPIKLPDGQFPSGLSVTLMLNPRDTQR